MKNIPRFKPFVFRELTPKKMRSRAVEFGDELHHRRSIRQFSSRSVHREIIEDVIRAAGSAPSGANLQPWRFVVIGGSEVKRRIREAAEVEERKFYGERAPEKWLKALSSIRHECQQTLSRGGTMAYSRVRHHVGWMKMARSKSTIM